MSQPPPPPGQPPSGGFGPPPAEDPQQPGYGYPQTPPPPAPGGGFGAPQEPQQPAPQPQYGYPPAPPAQPQQPPGPPQQPYGQPSQPPKEPYSFAQPVPPHSGGYPQAQVPGLPARSAAQKLVPVWTVIAAVVAILVVASGTGWFLTRDGEEAQAGGGGGGGGPKKTVSDSKPASRDGELLFGVPYPQAEEGATWPASGQWATEKIYAKGELNAVKGYDTKTGKESWKLPTGGLVCGASRAVTDDGKAAMLVQDGEVSDPDDSYAPCTEVVLFDVNSGEELWRQHVATADESVKFEHVTIAGDTVIASGLSGSAAFPLAGGDPVWQTKPTTECKDHDYASDGTNLLGLVFCGSLNEDMKVQKVDPATGGIYWSYDVPDGVQSVQVLSVEPPVITIGAGKTTETDIFALDKGKLRSKISLGTETEGPRYKPGCDYSGGAESCTTVAVDGDTMYLPSREHQGKSDYGDTNEIVAFDLNSGKPTKKYDAGEKRTMVPLRIDDGKIIAYRKGTYDTGGEILAIDPDSAKEEVWLELPNDTAEAETTMTYSDNVPYLFEHGRFYLAQDIISDRDDVEYFALAFGSKDQ